MSDKVETVAQEGHPELQEILAAQVVTRPSQAGLRSALRMPVVVVVVVLRQATVLLPVVAVVAETQPVATAQSVPRLQPDLAEILSTTTRRTGLESLRWAVPERLVPGTLQEDLVNTGAGAGARAISQQHPFNSRPVHPCSVEPVVVMVDAHPMSPQSFHLSVARRLVRGLTVLLEVLPVPAERLRLLGVLVLTGSVRSEVAEVEVEDRRSLRTLTVRLVAQADSVVVAVVVAAAEQTQDPVVTEDVVVMAMSRSSHSDIVRRP